MAKIKVNPEAIAENPFELIGKDWFLLTAGTEADGYNFMTCSWGAMGVLWNMPSVTCYVRHSRHTFSFMEKQDTFTLSFFGKEQRKALGFAGSHSGRDCDKLAETGLHPITLKEGVSFEEAKLILVCRKRFASDLSIADLPKDVAAQFYADGDTHRMYIGEIIAAYM